MICRFRGGSVIRLMMACVGGRHRFFTPKTMFVIERTAKAVQRHRDIFGIFAMLPRGESPVHHDGCPVYPDQ